MKYNKPTEPQETTNAHKEIPLQITFRGFSSSDAVSAAVQSRIENLERHDLNIISCEVVVSKPHQHSHKGSAYHVEIKLHIPGNDIYINREPEKDDSHLDIYIAIRDAFDALERKLKTRIDKMRSFTKTHEPVAAGQTASAFVEDQSYESEVLTEET